MSRKIHAFALMTVVVLVVAGCGGGSDSTTGAEGYGGETSTGADSESSGAYGGGGEETAAGSNQGLVTATVSLGNVPELGMVLVDGYGKTLYDFHKDTGATSSSCYRACAKSWLPLTTTGEPRAGNGVAASKLGTFKRTDGTTQVTYAGHPLYTFRGDEAPGEANGNDISAFGGEWYALKGSGEEPED